MGRLKPKLGSYVLLTCFCLLLCVCVCVWGVTSLVQTVHNGLLHNLNGMALTMNTFI